MCVLVENTGALEPFKLCHWISTFLDFRVHSRVWFMDSKCPQKFGEPRMGCWTSASSVGFWQNYGHFCGKSCAEINANGFAQNYHVSRKFAAVLRHLVPWCCLEMSRKVWGRTKPPSHAIFCRTFGQVLSPISP